MIIITVKRKAMFEKMKEHILDPKRQQEIFMAFARGEEVSLTPARIFQIFYNSHFNTFLNKHPEMGVGIAAVVASLYGAVHVCRKYFQWRESNDQLNVNLLLDCLDNLNHINVFPYSEFKEQRKGEFLSELRKIPGFQSYKFKIKDGVLSISNEKPQEIEKVESNESEGFINSCKKSSIYKLWVKPIWTALGVYSTAYWWLFMLTTMITAASGVIASNLLLFGLPMLFPAIMLLCHLGKSIGQYLDADADKKKQNKKDNKRKNEICRKALLAYFLQEYIYINEVALVSAKINQNKVIKNRVINLNENHNCAIDLFAVRDNDVATRVAEIKEEAISKKSYIENKINNERWLKIVIGGMTGFVTGYCIGVFNQWPILDFLSKVIGVSGVIGPHAIIISFIISVSIGLVYSFLFALGADRLHQNLKKEITNHEKNYREGELSYNVNEYMSIQQAKISGFKKEIAKRQKCLNEEILSFNSVVEDEQLKIDPSKFKFPVNQYLEMENNEFYKKRQEYNIGFMYIKKTLNRIAAFLAGAGTGMFLVRSLFMSGCIIALFCPLSLSLILSMACPMALMWGCVKLAEYYVNSLQEREQQLLSQANIRAKSLGYYALLCEKQLTIMVEQTAIINAMTKDVKRVKPTNREYYSSPLYNFKRLLEKYCDCSQLSGCLPLLKC